jgi:hypothetical protein
MDLESKRFLRPLRVHSRVSVVDSKYSTVEVSMTKSEVDSVWYGGKEACDT